MNIQGILFDYGNTLISIELDWEKIMPLNIANMIRYLKSKNIPVEIDPFGKRFVELKDLKHQQGQKEMHEYRSVDILRKTFIEFGLNHLSKSEMEEAVDAFFTPEESAYPTIEGAHQVLQTLKNHGYKLAVISNASSGELIQKAMNNRDFLKYFDTVIVSADVGYRKPHPKIYQMALQKINVSPENAVMIGDVPPYDITAPKQLGMKTILVKYVDSSEAKKHSIDIEPDAIAYHITDIPQIIDSWK